MSYPAPGVYLKYPTSGLLTIRTASTSTAVFIGKTVVGRTLAGTAIAPKLVTSVVEYGDRFSTAGCRSGVVSLPSKTNAALVDGMGQAVNGFFLNGGSKAYIVSTSSNAEATSKVVMTLKDGADKTSYLIEAASPGAWGNDIKVEAKASSLGAGFCDLDIRLTLAGDAGDVPVSERFVGVAADQVLKRVSSAIVKVSASATDDAELDTAAPGTSKDYVLVGGEDASETENADYAAIFNALRNVDDISLIVMPDLVWPDDKAAYEAAISHCQSMNDRMVLIQLADDTTDFKNTGLPLEKAASVYFPSADVVMALPGGKTRTMAGIGITGHVAGIYARTDAEKGPWTAPAGLQASIRGVTRLTKNISLAMQEEMNPNCINALRYIEGIPVVWGARTRDQDGIYAFIPVMRTAFLIGDSLRSALTKVVFAKNTEVLWKNVKASVTGFMGDLFAQGAFQGATPSQSFEVLCGLGESMSQTEIDGGLLRVTVRFKPARVAESIEISVEQKFEAAA